MGDGALMSFQLIDTSKPSFCSTVRQGAMETLLVFLQVSTQASKHTISMGGGSNSPEGGISCKYLDLAMLYSPLGALLTVWTYVVPCSTRMELVDFILHLIIHIFGRHWLS